MAYRPRLLTRVEVPALDAENPPVFWCGPADHAFGRIAALVSQDKSVAGAIAGLAEGDDSQIGPAVAAVMGTPILGTMTQIAEESVRRWEGVLGEDGEPLPCTAENIHNLPTQDRLLIGSAIAAALFVADDRGNAPSGSDTNSPGRDTNSAAD